MSAIDQKYPGTPAALPVERKLQFTSTPRRRNSWSSGVGHSSSPSKPVKRLTKDNEPELDGFWASVALRVAMVVRELWHWIKTVVARIRGLQPPQPEAWVVGQKQRLAASPPVAPLREKKQIPEFCLFENLEGHKAWFFTTVKKYTQLEQLFPKEQFDQQPFSLLLHVLKPVPEIGVFRGMTLSVRDRIWGPEEARPCVHERWREQFLAELEDETGINQKQLEQLFWVQQDFTHVEFFKLWKTDGLYDALQKNMFGTNLIAKTAFEQNPFVALVYLTQIEAQQYLIPLIRNNF